MESPADPLPDDVAALWAIIHAQRDELAKMAQSNRAYEALIEALQVQIAKLKKQKFGASSEKIARDIEQLELALEALEIESAAADTSAEPMPTEPARGDAVSPRRRGKPQFSADLERDRVTLDPGASCPQCGGELRLVGDDVSEILELVAARLKVIETVRPKKSCRHCEAMVQSPAPTRPVRRGMAGPGLLAHILVSKYDDHLPLYRQGEIFSRMGADIPRSTLIDWCGQGIAVLRPLTDRIRQHVFASTRLHADDTPIQVLDPKVAIASGGSRRAVKEGRIWVYVRDDTPFAGNDPPAAAYFFSPDRKGIHPQTHLAGFSGILQADAYSGFRQLYEPDPSTGIVRIREAACWAHLRRDFHDIWKATQSEIARQALDRIGALYDIERTLSGQSADIRKAVRQDKTRPLVDAFKAWAEQRLGQLSGKSDLAKAIRYGLNRWDAFTLFLEDGRVGIDNNPAERAMRPVAIGRKNFLFAGSDAGGERLADALTLIETAKLHGLNPEAYLADILARINEHMINRLDQLLPWKWTSMASASQSDWAAAV
ncbi:MAG TPA: IS66 family transposase [Arsenicitalea sp.]|jgi:transposase|nr:IS66 family transposase [Arsenicitalea sp.]